jgi:sortase (surface protein transpeptidase)
VAPPSRVIAAVLLLCGLLALSVAACGFAIARGDARPATPLGKPSFAPVPPGKRAPVPSATAIQAAPMPVSLVIPAIGISTSLIQLGLTASGQLQVPASTAVAGWYTGSPRPGATGAAVIAGHIDSYQGPGVFFRLRLMRPGQRVYVRRADGSVAVFQVTAVHTYLKSQFPTDGVYGATPNSQLRLITCGGTFDPATGHYLSNVIVYATLVG